MQKEIEKLRDSMSKNSGNLQNELNLKDQEIDKLTKRVQDLEKEIMKLKREM